LFSRAQQNPIPISLIVLGKHKICLVSQKRVNLGEEPLVHIVICGLVPRVLREHAVRSTRIHVRRLDVLLMYAVPLADGRRAAWGRHVVTSLGWHVPCRAGRWRVVAARQSVESIVVLMMLLLLVAMMLVMVLVVGIAAPATDAWTVMAETNVALWRSDRWHLSLRRIGCVRLRVHHGGTTSVLAWRSGHLTSGREHVGWRHRTRACLHHLLVLGPTVLKPNFNLKRKTTKNLVHSFSLYM